MPILKCPTCGAVSTINDAAPARLTCPRCMQPFDRNADEEQHRPPLPTLEYGIPRHRKSSSAPILVIIVLLLIGAGAMLMTKQPAAFIAVLFLIVPLILGLVLVLQWRKSSEPHWIDPDVENPATEASSDRRQPNTDYAAIGVLLFVVGVIIGFVLTAIACVATGPFGLVVPAIALVLAMIPGFRAASAGVLTGAGAILLLAMSLCGGIHF